jgi:drug/metabolite transporter (DMT)-like permease
LTSLITAALLLVIALTLEDRIAPPSTTGLLALIALTLVSHVGGQGFLTYALGHLPAAFSSLVIFLEAVVAAILGWLVFGEPVSALQAAGGVLILTGIFAARPRAR